ncbi:Nif3-like dinuclear metal center hexameric protein [Alkalilimnicola sp. S0819]|uniref:Nif3-like dinuclear metal center hexameric protein n=1 Tax=Alkalilimnicola sp. S0819 TaxID=2613922 RepID=UPI001262682D|nr:Nif3-like dinuclear metal center hexameric protein [Alkalilimnicola sp. S0819]KAB7623837.1 Nif3-like dinuclear metal center hexameric protein [Alkalilimnicola sp. S0819]MPQ16713.1 Nif3-like dinuclear metal center hexameric protein [Alkalilimnicola sp. S0819]
MVLRDDLLAYCDELLDAGAFSDYAPNGLQVEGRAEVRCIVSGVTASQALIDAAVAEGADLLLVHHGYFWKGEDARVVGMKARRLRALLAADMSLLAYHLPLDAHPELGNNAQLGQRLGLRTLGRFDTGTKPALGWLGELPEPLTGEAFAQAIGAALGRMPLHVAGGEGAIRRVAWCTGGAQGFIQAAAQAGADAYVSGEISEPTAHIARECGLHYYAAGHHATERYGAWALGEHLAQRYGLKHRFVDIDNPA